MIITIISKPLTAVAATESYRNRSAPDRMLSLFLPEKAALQPEYTTSGSYGSGSHAPISSDALPFPDSCPCRG